MEWVSTFGYLPLDYGCTLVKVKDQTQVVLFDNNLIGEYVCLRLSNRYSDIPIYR